MHAVRGVGEGAACRAAAWYSRLTSSEHDAWHRRRNGFRLVRIPVATPNAGGQLLDAVRPAALQRSRVLTVLFQAQGPAPCHRRLRLLRPVESAALMARMGVLRPGQRLWDAR